MAKCPFCGKYFRIKKETVDHINRKHQDQLDEMDASQALYFSVHKTLSGVCMCGCGKPTEWNYKTGKPHKVANDPECRRRIAEQADRRNINIYGKAKLIDDMDRQRNMLKHRHIAGEYVFADGGKISYVAKLEKNFLWFCDTILEFTSNMILEDSIHKIEIKYHDDQEDRDRIYIPDFYLPDYNALVEIKSSNSNPAFIRETKYKEKFKEREIAKQAKYNYIKIVDAKYGPFMEFLANIVENGRNATKNKPNSNGLYIVTESACTGLDEIPMNETSFPGLHVAVIKDPFIHRMQSIAISESGIFGKMYLADSTGLKETSLRDPSIKDYDIDIYQFCGKKSIGDNIIRDAINLSEAPTNTSGLNQIIQLFKEYDVQYNFDEAFTTDNRMSHFIKLGTLNGKYNEE